MPAPIFTGIPSEPKPASQTTPTPQQQVVAPAPKKLAAPLIDSHFDRDTDGFEYVDDAFRATKQPNYAEGVRIDAGAPQGGVLKVLLGGRDSNDIRGMSGGWRRSFTLEKPAPLYVSFRYELMQTSEYEDDEFSQALVTVDALLQPTEGKDYIAQFTGDGNGGLSPTTGWKTFSVSLGQLAPGAHSLTIGAYNNKKTATNETTEMRIDDVRVATEPITLTPVPKLPGPPPRVINPAPQPKSTQKPDDTF